MSSVLKGLNEGRNYGRDSWDSNMPGYQGDYGGAENFGRRNREWDEDDRIDARIRAEYEKKKEYEQNGKFWLKLKDSQRHLPSGPFVGKQSANQAAIDLLKQQPELKGNLVITAYGPDEQVNELSNNTLASYKKKAGADASAADKAGDYKRGDKRFSGIVKATKKQFANDEKGVAEVSDATLTSYLTKLDRDNLKHRMDPTKRSDAKRMKSGPNFVKAFTKLDNRKQGVAEGLGKSIKRASQGWGVGAAPDMVTPSGAVSAFKNMDGQRLANFVASRKDQSKPRKNSAGAFVDKVIDREMRQRGYGRVANKDEQGVAEGVAETLPMDDAVKVLRQYGAGHFKTTSNELHFYKQGRPFSVDLVMNPDATRSVTLSSLNSATRGLKGQGVAEGAGGVSVRQWANQVRKDHGADVKFRNRQEGGGAVDSVIAKNSQGETVGVYNRKTGYPTVYEPKQGVAEEQLDELKCWSGYTRVQGVPAGAPGSCKKKTNEEDVAEATGDVKFDKMLKGITGKKEVAKQQKIDTKQQARDAFGGMFGGGNPADKLSIRKKGVAEGQEEKCPHCGGAMFSEMIMNEKKDACYYKVKSRYKVWPSAYASGALVKCRKSGADSWGDGGKKNESSILEGIEQVDENLNKWFKEKWVRFGPDGKIRGDCARGDDSEGKPKCLPQSKAQNLGKEGRASAAARKRREDPNPERSGKAINVNTKKK